MLVLKLREREVKMVTIEIATTTCIHVRERQGGELGACMSRGVKVVGRGLCEGDDEATTVLWPAPVRDEREKKKKKDKNVAPYSHLRDLREGKGEGEVACLRGVWRRAYYLLIPWW